MPLPQNVPASPRRSSRIASQRDQSVSTSDAQPGQNSYDLQSTQSSSVVTDTSSNDSTPFDFSPLVNELRDSRTSEEGAVGGLEEPRGPLDCAICLQPCVHPAKLPCSHIFCFLCLKGFAQQSRRCAMCRSTIPHDYLERPELVQVPEPSSLENGYQWFYEGRNGWWQYDDRTSQDLELNYQSGERLFELLIAGNIYLIDFNDMVQYRKVDPVKKRRIKRDMSLNSSRIKGIAGLRVGQPGDTQPAADPSQLPQDPRDHTSNDHNYSLMPDGPARRARIQSSILNPGGTTTVWYTDDPAVNSIDDSSRHDHLYTRREAMDHVRNPRPLDQVGVPHNPGHAAYEASTGHRETQRSQGVMLETLMLRRSAFERAADLHLGHFLGRVEDPFGYHSLVENGSGLSEIFHMLRFAMRDVRHILTDLRDQILLWPVSVRLSRCLEIASLVRRLLVATDMQVLYPLFLEFSRIVQDRLRSQQHGARQDDFLLQLNNEALDKARLCMCHSARLTPDYVSRARDILQRHVLPATPSDSLRNTHQGANASSSGQQTSTAPSSVSSSGRNQEASARPRRQLHTSLNRVVGMVEDQTIKYALFREMLNIRRLLNLTLIRINEEQANEPPLERQEGADLLSQDTWNILHRVVHSVLELYCGPMVRNTGSASSSTSVQAEDPSRNQVVFVPIGYPEDSTPLSSVTPLILPDASSSSSASRTMSFNSALNNASTLMNGNHPVVYNEDSASSVFVNRNTSFPWEVYPSSSRTSASSSRGSQTSESSTRGDRYENCSCPTCVYVEDTVSNLSDRQSFSGESSQGNRDTASHGNASEYSHSYPLGTSHAGSEYTNASYPGTNWTYELNNDSTCGPTNGDVPAHIGALTRNDMPASANGSEGTCFTTDNTGPHPYSRYAYSGNRNSADGENRVTLLAYDGSAGQVNRQVSETETRIGRETEATSTVIAHDYDAMVNPEFREADEYTAADHSDRNSGVFSQSTHDRQTHPMTSSVDNGENYHRHTRDHRCASATYPYLDSLSSCGVTDHLECHLPAECFRNTANPLLSPDNLEAFYRNVETSHNTDESDINAQNEINEYIDSERDNTLEHNFETVHIASERENGLGENLETYQTMGQSDEVVRKNEGMVDINDEIGATHDIEEYRLVSSTNDQIGQVRADNRDIVESNNVILEANNVILDANNGMGNSHIPRDHQYSAEAAAYQTSETFSDNNSCGNQSNSDTRDSLAESGHQYYVNLSDNQVLLTNESCENVQLSGDNEYTRRRRKSCSSNRNDSDQIDRKNNIAQWDLQTFRQSNQSVCSYNTCDSEQCLCNTGTSSQSGNMEEDFYLNQVNQEPSNALPQTQRPIPHCVFHETHSSYTHTCPISAVHHTECQQRHDLATYSHRANTRLDDSNRYFSSANRNEGGDSRNSGSSERFEIAYQQPPEYYFNSNNNCNANNTPCENGVSALQYSRERSSNLQTRPPRSSNFQSCSGNSGSYDNFGFEDILSQTNLSFNAKEFVPKSVSNGANEAVANQETTHAGPHFASYHDETFDGLEDIPEHLDITYESDTLDSTDANQLDVHDPLDIVETHCDSSEPIETNARPVKKATDKHETKGEDLNKHNYTKDKTNENFQDEAKGGNDGTDFEDDNLYSEDSLKQDTIMDETLINDQTVMLENPLVPRNIAMNEIRSPVINNHVDMNEIESPTINNSVPMSESLTVTDHNYAATTKHTQLTRQDSEHSYACKKLKSSRKNSKNKLETKSKQCVMPANNAKESKIETEHTMVNTEHAYSKHSVSVAAFDHEYAKACWSETGLVDKMNYLTLQESEDEDDDL